MAIIDFFDRGWDQNASGTAFVMGERSWTYQEAGELTCQIASALLDTEVTSTGHAAVLSPNDPVAWMCVLGIWRAGRAWVPLHPGEPTSTLAGLIRQFDCEALFFHSSMRAEAEELCATVPDLALMVCIDSDQGGSYPSLATWIHGRPVTRPDVPYSMDDVVMISPTGGTTGLPKGVMNTHRTLANTCAHLLMAFEYGHAESIVNLAAAPLTHSAGIITLPTTARGGTVVIIPRADPASVVEAPLERHRPATHQRITRPGPARRTVLQVEPRDLGSHRGQQPHRLQSPLQSTDLTYDGPTVVARSFTWAMLHGKGQLHWQRTTCWIWARVLRLVPSVNHDTVDR
ncbi:AMP-binding protein [Nocardia rhizosphaerihabitans]|uniref:AMP-dependent synthetase/ligase domain-containing protein n=1 Tax=Nocardia rhizosphaerihabitans TaxID=1691570 RepID=A0ABQ2KWZ2_9NOCA|nr:class I adenylate-forming enzyme family protein [Nocardia rhizosphaerihabitans]GGN94048.1 hypothetical protein GCM10011610_56590 [Nocardia rhizosphaerihabitans]